MNKTQPSFLSVLALAAATATLVDLTMFSVDAWDGSIDHEHLFANWSMEVPKDQIPFDVTGGNDNPAEVRRAWQGATLFGTGLSIVGAALTFSVWRNRR